MLDFIVGVYLCGAVLSCSFVTCEWFIRDNRADDLSFIQVLFGTFTMWWFLFPLISILVLKERYQEAKKARELQLQNDILNTKDAYIAEKRQIKVTLIRKK